MIRYIFYGVLIYLLYLGIKAFTVKFQNLKNIFKSPSSSNKSGKFSKKDLNHIEDADFEEIKKP